MDTDALVKLTKGSAKEIVGSAFEVVLPPGVYEEAVERGKAGGHADAFRIEENVRQGLLVVRRPPSDTRTERLIEELGLAGGEADLLRLLSGEEVEAAVSDDSRFLHILEGLGVRYATPSALLVLLRRTGALPGDETRAKLDALAPFISEEEYLEAQRALEEG